MKTITCYNCGIELIEARHLTDQEKAQYRPEFHNSILIGIGVHFPLAHVMHMDLAELYARKKYSFPGCGNMAWEITDAEWDHFVELDAARAAEKASQKVAEEIAVCKDIIRRAEAQKDIPSRAEADRRKRAYILVENEGGEGYVPTIIDIETYDACVRRLAELSK